MQSHEVALVHHNIVVTPPMLSLLLDSSFLCYPTSLSVAVESVAMNFVGFACKTGLFTTATPGDISSVTDSKIPLGGWERWEEMEKKWVLAWVVAWAFC